VRPRHLEAPGRRNRPASAEGGPIPTAAARSVDVSPASLIIEPLAVKPDAVVPIPGSKSHTNRALVCAALAGGTSTLDGVLFAADTEAMMRALAALGVGIDTDRLQRRVVVDGGIDRLRPGPRQLDLAQSGTTSRFLAAVATLGPGPYVLDGDEQLRARPFGPLVAALRSLGADIDGEHLPLRIAGGGIRCGRIDVSGSVSSQFLSGLLLAAPGATAPGASGEAEVEIVLSDELVSKPYVDLTIATMAAFGADVNNERYQRFSVAPQPYRPQTVPIEPDASAASYFFAAAAITGGRIRVEGLGRHTVQGDLGFVDILDRMGATVRRGDDWTEVIGSGHLNGVDVDLSDMSDTAQTLAVTASFATSPTRVRGIDFIKNKEIDRVAAVVEELTARGIRAERTPGGFTIYPGSPSPGTVRTRDDHRMAMSFALLGLVHPGIRLDDPDCVGKTFPNFFAVLDRLR